MFSKSRFNLMALFIYIVAPTGHAFNLDTGVSLTEGIPKDGRPVVELDSEELSALASVDAPDKSDIGSDPDASSELWYENEDESTFAKQNAERRAQRSRGVGYMLGPSIPWNSHGVEGFYFHSPLLASQTAISFGNYLSRQNHRGSDFNLAAHPTTFSLGLMYFVSRTIPIAVTPAINFSQWTGNLEHIGSTSTESATNAVLIAGEFNSLSAAPSLGLCLHFVLDSGIYLNYTLFSVAQAFVLSYRNQNGNELSESITRNALSELRAWGLVNLKLGYQF